MHYSSWSGSSQAKNPSGNQKANGNDRSGSDTGKRLERVALRRTRDHFYASVTAVLVVVEGVAGYKRISIQGNSYVFEKRDFR